MRAFLLCMAFACANAAAQSAPPATFQAQSVRGLPALLARAVPRDPQVVAAQAAMATTEARYKQARSRLFPNAALQATLLGAAYWCQHTPASIHFATLPFFHVTGFQQSMHVALATGAVAVPPGTKDAAMSTASPGPRAWSWMVASE